MLSTIKNDENDLENLKTSLGKINQELNIYKENYNIMNNYVRIISNSIENLPINHEDKSQYPELFTEFEDLREKIFSHHKKDETYSELNKAFTSGLKTMLKKYQGEDAQYQHLINQYQIVKQKLEKEISIKEKMNAKFKSLIN